MIPCGRGARGDHASVDETKWSLSRLRRRSPPRTSPNSCMGCLASDSRAATAHRWGTFYDDLRRESRMRRVLLIAHPPPQLVNFVSAIISLGRVGM